MKITTTFGRSAVCCGIGLRFDSTKPGREKNDNGKNIGENRFKTTAKKHDEIEKGKVSPILNFFKMKSLTGKSVDLSQYRSVVMIVNTATMRMQYAGLQSRTKNILPRA